MNDTQQWKQHRAFGAVDWASEKHSVIVVDEAGKVIEDFEIEHSALGWKKFREKLQPYGSIPFAIETSQGAAVEQLLEAGMSCLSAQSQERSGLPRTQSSRRLELNTKQLNRGMRNKGEKRVLGNSRTVGLKRIEAGKGWFRHRRCTSP